MEIEQVSINHKFTDTEMVNFASEQARLLGEMDSLEAQLDSAKKQFNSQIAQCQASIRVISGKIHTRSEFRNAECIVMDHRISGMRFVARLDTGHVVKSRRLDIHERQMSINDGIPPEFVAIALLPVDDHSYDAELVELHVLADEFEALRSLPDVKMRPLSAGLLAEPEPETPLHNGNGTHVRGKGSAQTTAKRRNGGRK